MDKSFDKGYDDYLKKSSLNEIGDTDKGQYALGQLAARQASKGDAWGLVHTNEHAWEQHRTRSKKY